MWLILIFRKHSFVYVFTVLGLLGNCALNIKIHRWLDLLCGMKNNWSNTFLVVSEGHFRSARCQIPQSYCCIMAATYNLLTYKNITSYCIDHNQMTLINMYMYKVCGPIGSLINRSTCSHTTIFCFSPNYCGSMVLQSVSICKMEQLKLDGSVFTWFPQWCAGK